MRNILKRKNGEGYVDVAVTVMIVAFVLLFAVNMVSLVALNQNIKTVSDQLVEYASQKGTTAIGDYADELKEKIGVDFTYSFEESELIDESGKDLPVSHFDTARSVMFSFSASCICVRFCFFLHSAINLPIFI